MKYGWATCLPHKGGGVPLSALPKDNKQACRFVLHTIPFFMLSAKQGSCEYHFLKSFGMTRHREWTQVYRVRCGRSHHYTIAAVVYDQSLMFSQALILRLVVWFSLQSPAVFCNYTISKDVVCLSIIITTF